MSWYAITKERGPLAKHVGYFWPSSREAMLHFLIGLRHGWGWQAPLAFDQKMQRPNWRDTTNERFWTLWDHGQSHVDPFRFVGWLWAVGRGAGDVEGELHHGSQLVTGSARFAVLSLQTGQEMDPQSLPAVV